MGEARRQHGLHLHQRAQHLGGCGDDALLVVCEALRDHAPAQGQRRQSRCELVQCVAPQACGRGLPPCQLSVSLLLVLAGVRAAAV